MNFEQVKAIEPELGRLEESARFAGEHGATWPATLEAIHEALTKCVGRGANREALQTAEAYETARAAIHRAWRGVEVCV